MDSESVMGYIKSWSFLCSRSDRTETAKKRGFSDFRGRSDLTNGTIEMKICTMIQKTCPLLQPKTKLRTNEQYGRQMAEKTI